MQTIIQTPTPNLSESLHFYQQLNFKALSGDHPNIMTDGQVTILVNPDRFARLSIHLFKENWSTTLKLLRLQDSYSLTKVTQGHLLSDPNGVQVYLSTINYPIPSANLTPAIVGTFAGVSIETTDLKSSIHFWQTLGFHLKAGSAEQGWLTFSNGGAVDISIMKAGSCPHLFFNPSLTYFNGKNNLAIIDKIKALSIPITEEITHFNKEGIVDNIIIRDPGGLGFFIFND